VRREMMPSRLRRRGWQDVDKSDIRVTDLVQAYLLNLTAADAGDILG
jgi:hypothetical protein